MGLTGGIGSGKSIVARMLRILGVPVFEADEAGRDLLANDDAVHSAVVARFGNGVLTNGVIDRQALATLAFGDEQALADLNAIIHPAVRSTFEAWRGRQEYPYVVMESALLADTGGYRSFDRVVVVSAPGELRIRRVMQRDGTTEEAVRARMAHQVGEEERIRIADHVIVNDDHQLVVPQVLTLHRQLLHFAAA